MNGFDQYLVVYLVSQVVAILVLLVAYKSTRSGRLLFALMFILASGINISTGLIKPDTYLEYANMAVPLYRNFINGWFSYYNYIIIPVIAIGQLLVGMGMLLKDWWVRWSCIGAIIFLLSIAPLMVGSAFPSSLIVAWAAWVILKRDKKDYLWKHFAGIKTASGINKRHPSLDVSLLLSRVALMLSLLASATGLFGRNIYRDNEFVQTVWRANDWVTMLVVIPTFTILIFRRDTTNSQLLRAGLLGYLIYNYAFYLFGASFNGLFLVYVAIVSLSLFALISLLSNLPVQELSIPPKLSKFIMMYMLLIALMLFATEVPPSITFTFTGTLPEIVTKSAHPTNIVYALDLTLIVPLAVLSAVWLSQKKPWGVVLSAIMLVKGATYGMVLCASTILLIHNGLDKDPLLPFYIFITVGGIAGLTGLLKSLVKLCEIRGTASSSQAEFPITKPAPHIL